MTNGMVFGLVAGLVWCESYDAGQVQREFTPLVCEGPYVSNPDIFVSNLFNGVEEGTRIYARDENHLHISLQAEIGYTALFDLLGTETGYVQEQHQPRILCDARKVVEAVYIKAADYTYASFPDLAENYLTLGNSIAERNGIDTKPYAEVVVEAAYAQAADYAGGQYPVLADKYITFGDSVAERNGIDTKPYAEEVITAACAKVAYFANTSYPNLGDQYVTRAARVAKKDKTEVCQ